MVRADPRWYETAFGRHYLDVYAHRDDAAAAAEAAFLARALDLAPGRRVLDVACGAGRHARAFAGLGLRVAAVDLSPALLGEARRRPLPGSPPGGPAYLRADMRRLPLRPVFDAACLLFTSFGYFADSSDDARALAEVAGCLAPGGRLALDLLNRPRVLASLVADSRRELPGGSLCEQRWITADGRRVEKRVVLAGPSGPPLEYIESVRLYGPDEIDELLAAAGLDPLARHGDLAGGPHHAGADRLLVVARRPC